MTRTPEGAVSNLSVFPEASSYPTPSTIGSRINRSSGSLVWGKFRLKNVGRAFEIFAVSTDGLEVPAADFLHGKGERFASLPSNLPEPETPLLGRDGDLSAGVDLLERHRVVTVTGPGGIEKTRMAIEVCQRLASRFLDGVAFVSLAAVTDAADFAPAMAEALDVKEAEGRSLTDDVAGLIADKEALLLLDNLEQVVSAAPEVATLVSTCPGAPDPHHQPDTAQDRCRTAVRPRPVGTPSAGRWARTGVDDGLSRHRLVSWTGRRWPRTDSN